jgi:Caspase domain
MKISLIASLILLAAGLAQSQSPNASSRGLKPVGGQPDSVGKPGTGKNYALIIATDDYDDKSWPHLQNPVNDARTIADELKTNYGYVEPDLLFNATLDDVSTKLASYLDRKFDPGDSLLIFFAGHGKFDEKLKRGYLVFRNSKHVDPLNRSYLSHSDLGNTVDAIACNRILLVIDACFGGTFDNQVASLRGSNDLAYPEASKAEIVARKSGLTTRLFLTSGGKEYVPDGRPGAHSPFASEILRALRSYGGDSGLVTFQDLFQQVDKTAQNNPQYGWFGKADPGSDFWFTAEAPVSRVTPHATPDGPDISDPLTTSKDKNYVLRNFRTLYVEASGAKFFGADELKAALERNKDFAALNIRVVDDLKLADVVLSVGYTFAWDYPFQLKHQGTSTVLLAGKGSGPFSGPLGAIDVSKEFIKLAKPYRAAQAPGK